MIRCYVKIVFIVCVSKNKVFEVQSNLRGRWNFGSERVVSQVLLFTVSAEGPSTPQARDELTCIHLDLTGTEAVPNGGTLVLLGEATNFVEL